MTDPFADDPHLAMAMQGRNAARFLAVLDQAAQPHLVPALSANRDDEGLVRVAAVLPAPVEAALERGDAAALLVVDERFRWWTLRLTPTGFAAGTDAVKRWALLKATGVAGSGRHSGLRLTSEFAWARLLGIARGEDYQDVMPPELAQRWATLKAIKGIAFATEAGPDALPCLATLPAGPGALVCPTKTVPRLREIPVGAAVALALLTFEPRAFQVHGRFEGVGGGMLPSHATVRLTRVVNALGQE